jgi:hypothetical protein
MSISSYLRNRKLRKENRKIFRQIRQWEKEIKPFYPKLLLEQYLIVDWATRMFDEIREDRTPTREWLDVMARPDFLAWYFSEQSKVGDEIRQTLFKHLQLSPDQSKWTDRDVKKVMAYQVMYNKNTEAVLEVMRQMLPRQIARWIEETASQK